MRIVANKLGKSGYGDYLLSLLKGILGMSSQITVDAFIVGAGMVGLSIAWQLLENDSSLKIAIIDKDPDIGKHSSGRNSGILHEGIY